MPIPAYELYRPYEEDKFKTSTQKKVEQALEEAGKGRAPEVRELLVELEEAREVFGKDFLGPEAIEQTYNVRLSPEELETVQHIPFSREELEKAKDLGMMLVLRAPKDAEGRPLTISRIRELFKKGDTLGDPKKKKSSIFWNQDWYQNEEFATKHTTNLGWGLVAKEVLPESLSKNWDEQQQVLAEWATKNGLDPNTIRRRTPIEVVYDTILRYGANKESVLEKRWDWTSVQSSCGGPVCVGYFDSEGLYVYSYSRGGRGSGLGVCPSR